jgi:hypothetical protein
MTWRVVQDDLVKRSGRGGSFRMTWRVVQDVVAGRSG